MRLVIDIAGCAAFPSEHEALALVAESFGDYWYATMPEDPDGEDCVLLTDDRSRAIEWKLSGGTAIYLASIDETTADTVLVFLIELRRKLINATR
jgi:hypothetical protein